MAAKTEDSGGGTRFSWRIAGWSVPALLLLLPLVTNAPWTLSDFVFMGILVGVVGLVLELAVRASDDLFHRAGAAIAVAAAFFLISVNGAVGILGSEDNPANSVFLGVLVVAVVGSVLAGFKPAGLARAMFATAVAQVLVGVGALAAGLGSAGNDRFYEAALGTGGFTALWLISAGLFRKAADRQATVSAQ